MNHKVAATFILVAFMATVSAQEPTEDAAKVTAVLHLKRGMALVERGRLEAAEREFDLALIAYPDGPALYSARGNVRFQQKNYLGAIEDLDVYLTKVPDDAQMLLLRGIAKSLLEPEDVVGACADFLNVREHTKDMGIENYCHDQPGWKDT